MSASPFLPASWFLVLALVAGAAHGQPSARDLHGDPLPAGAVARLGTDRWLQGVCHFAAFLPDGKRVVTVSPDRTIRVWEFPSGKEIKRITPPEPDKGLWRGFRGAYHAALSKDGKTIALGGTDIYLCDISTGKESARLKPPQFKGGPPTGFNCLDFSPDGTHLTSVTYDGTFHIWDWAKGKQVGRCKQTVNPLLACRSRFSTPTDLFSAQLLRHIVWYASS